MCSNATDFNNCNNFAFQTKCRRAVPFKEKNSINVYCVEQGYHRRDPIQGTNYIANYFFLNFYGF